MMLWSAHPWDGALNYMFMSSNWTGLPMNGTRWHITCPITQISCRKIMSSNSFWGKWYFVFGQKNVQWQEKCFFVFTKNPLWVVWNGEMIRKYELSVPCLTGHTPRLTFQRFPQFNTKLTLRVHFQSNLDQLIMLLYAILKNLSHVHLDHGVGTTHNQNKQVGNAGWELF